MTRTGVIFNPTAGRGDANRRIAAAVSRSRVPVELMPTRGLGHAVELAQAAAEAGFGRIVAAGGDGTVHEVANGILQANRPEVIFSVWPLGSMNDYAHALGLDKPGPRSTARVDVGLVRAGGRERFFVNGLGVGFNGMVTYESRKVRSLRGFSLYVAAFAAAAVRHFRRPPVTIAFDGIATSSPTLALSVNLGQREGGFPVTPAARLDDGLFDTFHARDVHRWHLVRYFPMLVRGTLPADHPLFGFGRCSRVTVQCESPLCVHADGEFVCLPSEGVTEIAVELLPKKLLVEVGWSGGGASSAV